MPRQYYGPAMRSSLQMMAPPFTHSPAHAAQTSQLSDAPATKNQDSGTQRRKNRWNDTEERILIELFGENEDKLRYKSFNSPEWQSIARQLHERCTREKVESNKSAQQCKNKMANLTKEYKAVKDKLRTTGYGKGGDDELDKETESESDLIPRHFNDMDDILGNREAVNPKHVLESSSYVESSPENDCDLLEKEALDGEILSAAHAQKERDTPGPSGEGTYCADASDDEDDALAFSRSLFFKNKSGKRKPRTSTPNTKSREREKPAKKNVSKKAKRTTGAEEQSTVLSFLERAQERDEAFLERMAEAEKESRREQQKFSMDALAMLENTLKDVAKGKE